MTLQLTKPPIGSTAWGDDVNDNWQKIMDLSAGYSGRNRIINGAFDIWQRGTASVSLDLQAFLRLIEGVLTPSSATSSLDIAFALGP